MDLEQAMFNTMARIERDNDRLRDEVERLTTRVGGLHEANIELAGDLNYAERDKERMRSEIIQLTEKLTVSNAKVKDLEKHIESHGLVRGRRGLRPLGVYDG